MTDDDRLTNTEYRFSNNAKVHGVGILMKKRTFEKYFTNRIKPYNNNDAGLSLLKENFPGLQITNFDHTTLHDMFDIKTKGNLGESIAICYLTDHDKSNFPYRASHDLKNPDMDLGGADLIGFFETDDDKILQFGEVKTSEDKKQPPQVVTKSGNGLNAQLKNLKTDVVKRQNLLMWLGYKIAKLSRTNQIRQEYEEAIRLYNADQFRIVGVLVRDTLPNKNDLKSSFDELSEDLNSNIYLKLLAIYLPTPINNLIKRLRDE